jgi:N-acetylmuramoyl-L-alanine amidase
MIYSKTVKKLSRIVVTMLLLTTLLAALPISVSAAAADDGKTVITLDPGHGGRTSDDGSTGLGTAAAEQFGGVNELYYNLAISLYVKARLEQYRNTEVYLTRDNNEDCPGLKERADIATSHNSDALISIHNNSGGSGSKGAEVIIPNQNYRSVIGTASKSCATMILNNLTAQTGLAKRTVYTKNSTSVTYPDGSVADHFQVIRNGKLQNIGVVMIVECGFLSNPSEEKLLVSAPYQQKVAYAIFSAVHASLGKKEHDHE